MDNNDFLEQQRRAIERMNEMHLKQQIKTGGYKMPPTPSFVKLNNNKEKSDAVTDQTNNENIPKNFNEPHKKETKTSNINPKSKGFSLPFLSGGQIDRDISLLLGLILILANEKADRKLLLALLYILM